VQEEASRPRATDKNRASLVLLAGLVALAACTAVTRQPDAFGPRQALVSIAIVAIGLSLALLRERAGMAWPLSAGLALATAYHLAYDPVLPEALGNRLPLRIAILEPTTPTIIVLVLVLWWVLRKWPWAEQAPAGSGQALQALGIVARLLIGLGIVLYLALSGVYDLEGGFWFWKLTLVCTVYLGLGWIGIEGAARGFLDWKALAVLLLGVLLTVARHFLGSQGA